MKFQYVFSVVALSMTAFASQAQQSAGAPIRVVIDGSEMQFPDQQPIEVNGRVLVPLRGVFERLGAEVNWDDPDQTVTAYKHGVRVELAIGQHHATVNGRRVDIDSPARVVNGSTMVPLRFVSQAMGAEVNWNAESMKADITRGNRNVIMANQTGAQDPEMVSRPVRPAMQTPATSGRSIAANTVIPWSLNDRLSSNNANEGDPFTATLVTNGHHSYMGIPAGSVLAGTIGYVRTQQGDKTGVLELRFEHIVTPGGRTIPIHGRLIALDGKSVSKMPNGTFFAKSPTRNERDVFAGMGSGAGQIIGLISDRSIGDADMSGLVGLAVGAAQTQQPSEVVLVQGTEFGLLIRDQLSLPTNLK